MSCSFSLNGNQCTLADPRHYDTHITADKVRFTDRGSDQGQAKAA